MSTILTVRGLKIQFLYETYSMGHCALTLDQCPAQPSNATPTRGEIRSRFLEKFKITIHHCLAAFGARMVNRAIAHDAEMIRKYVHH